MTEMVVKQGNRVSSIRDALEAHVTGTMHITGEGGDVKVTWNARDPVEVESARKQFDDLRGQRFLAFSVAPGGGKGEQITAFDPDAQKIILAPPMAGGAAQ